MHPTTSNKPTHHHLRPMRGRDPNEADRAATPLELLFDLTFVVAFGLAANELAHAVAEGQFDRAFLGYALASFAICLAWASFSWFASAYDTDDWVFRLLTMTQMIGVLVLALGLPRMFRSLEVVDGRIDTSAMVFGYVVMRIALILQWLRAARQNPMRRRACLTYAAVTTIAQGGWIALFYVGATGMAATALILVMVSAELVGPWLAERRDGGTPWNPHHIVERNALFATIALGEGVVGTVASLSAAVESQGWTTDAALVGIAGLGLTFGLWWVYSILPSVTTLAAYRNRSFVWGYLQMVIVSTIVAIGAGLHVAALHMEHHAKLDTIAVVLFTALPVALFIVLIYALHWYLLRRVNPLQPWLLSGTGAILAIAIVASAEGVSLPVCLCLVAIAPWINVVGYELSGHRFQSA